jgi:hypothetical protein
VLLWPSLIRDVAKLDAQWGDISAADKEMLRFAVALVRSAEPSREDLAEATGIIGDCADRFGNYQ